MTAGLFIKARMAIRALCRQEFDRFAATDATLADNSSKAVEWFADDTDRLLGTIAHHRSDLFSILLFGRQHQGTFVLFGVDYGFHDADQARQLLVARMEKALPKNDIVLPIPSSG